MIDPYNTLFFYISLPIITCIAGYYLSKILDRSFKKKSKGLNFKVEPMEFENADQAVKYLNDKLEDEK